MGAIEIFGKYYSGVIIEAMEGIACREMWGGVKENSLGDGYLHVRVMKRDQIYSIFYNDCF